MVNIAGDNVQVAGGIGSTHFAYELYFVSFDVFYAQDVELCKEVKTKIIDGVSENGFLEE